MPTSTAPTDDLQAASSAPSQANSALQVLAADAAHEARTHAVLIEVQQQLSADTLSDQDLFQRAAQAALEATGGEGACIELLQAQDLHCAASAGRLLGTPGSSRPVADCVHWPLLAQGQSLRRSTAPAAGGLAWNDSPGTPLCSALQVPLQRDGVAVGVITVGSSLAGAFAERDLAHLLILSESVGSLLKAREVAAQLHASQQQYEALFQIHPQPMWVFALDERLTLLAANQAMAEVYGYSREELLGMALPDLWPPGAHEMHRQALKSVEGGKSINSLILQHQRKDGRLIDVEIASRATQFNGVAARQSMAVDVTERLVAEREVARMARARHLLSECNEAIVRATSEAELLDAVCRITVDVGGYRMAWVGLARDDDRKTIDCVAHAGTNGGYLESLTLSWDEHSEHGQGPSGVVVRSGEAVVVRDVLQTPAYAGLAPRLLARGFHGMVCLPLKDGPHTFGVLYLYAPQVLEISTHERDLLGELAEDLAFGMLSLRARQQQQQMQAAVVKVAASVSATTGTTFFEHLVQNMVQALGAETGCLGRFVPSAHGAPESLLTLALVINGELAPNAEYLLSGTPSEHLATEAQFCVVQGLRAQFPHSVVVGQTAAEAYVGQQLCDSGGTVIGMLFVLFRQPLQNVAFLQSTLQIFASRASAEIQRLEADAHIRRQASLLDQARDAIIVRDLQHRVLYWNQGAERLYGWTAEQVLGRRIDELLHLDRSAFERASEAVHTHGEWIGEMVQFHRDGQAIDTEGRWTLVTGEAGQADSILAINTDIRERKATEREIQRLAFYDALTGLPNRMLLLDRARHALSTAARQQEGGALLFIDLDNFKTLNDTLGHDQGDLLLEQVARRLETCVRGSDTVARLGGDEFVVMLEGLSSDPADLAMEARAAAEKILLTLAQPYQLDGCQYRTTPSIGIAPFARGDSTVGDLLKQADLAMYQAKTGGRNTLRFYDPDMQAVVSARAEMEADMRSALAQDEFLLHYQPQVRHDGRLVGVEALARWRHPVRGLVPPGEFIPVAEETGLILTLGRWVLHTACRTLARWQDQPQLRHLSMAVNVSSKQFRSGSFVDDVGRVLAVTGAPAKRLKLELTESVLVDNVEAIISTMDALRALGVGFSLDDFGTGYSSLSYLKRMPLHQLKIDQSFVRDLLTDPNDAAIVDTIVALSAALGLDVIAEGVETLEQREMLLQAGCMAFQGYLYSRPLDEAALQEMLHRSGPMQVPSIP
ncbi:MAG: EAL domain-containing protein [Simplicispira suum]|uniref:bifunctional diguanylate cyclase/phosphodiesterase n=1 Tax=Simplicispira suum TaxID=2109915 RepID=UPI001C6C9504|nr:EAL domain-containing protein [Simplicispira suum]MBW7834584.1 EAL domain-containing protein [Simplicispira suum]